MDTPGHNLVAFDPVIIKLQQAANALTEASNIQQTKRIMDVATAALVYAKEQKLGEESESIALSIKIDALRKIGEILQHSEKRGTQHSGGGGSKGSKREPLPDAPPTLAELGLDKKTSSIAQKLAALPEKAFQEVRQGHETVAKAIAAVSTTKPAAKTEAPEPPPKPEDINPDNPDFKEEVDLVDELEHAAKEIDKLNQRITSLTKTDAAKELDAQLLKYDQLEGRLQQEITTGNEARKQAKYQTVLLNEIRKVLNVQKNNLIVPRIKELMK